MFLWPQVQSTAKNTLHQRARRSELLVAVPQNGEAPSPSKMKTLVPRSVASSFTPEFPILQGECPEIYIVVLSCYSGGLKLTLLLETFPTNLEGGCSVPLVKIK